MQLADRRVTARFEVVGELWGSVQTLEPLRICNLAPEGALVESLAPLPVGSVQPIRLVQGAQSTEVRAAVRHLTAIYPEGGGRRYRVGLEFLNVDEQAAWRIGSLMDEQRQESAQNGEA
jgi:hypothetical protein